MLRLRCAWDRPAGAATGSGDSIRIDGSGDICAGEVELVAEGQDAEEHGFEDEDERFYEVDLDAEPPDCGEGREQNHTRRRFEFC